MCSIFGQINFGNNKLDHNETVKLSSLLKHRGPDDEGFYNDNKVSLSFNRLSIIDLEKGNQPIFTYDVISIFNGEIYNFKEIKKELINKGYKFKTNSDSEVIPVAYRAWGINFLKKLRGMFAICIYDLKAKRIFLARDQIGIKPLYYFIVNKKIIFGSEIKALINHSEFKREINFDAVSSYLLHRYTINNKSNFFKNIISVKEGSFIEIDLDKNLMKENEYFELKILSNIRDKGEKYYLELIEEKLIQSVKRHLISDVPISVFLSGGLDSSLISSIASKNLRYKLNTFSVGFEESYYDESDFARKVSKYINSDHKSIQINQKNFVDNLREIIRIKSTPVSIPHEFPLYKLSSEIKNKNKVVLSGEGADEFFGGYARVQNCAIDFLKLKKLGKFSKNNIVQKIFSLDKNFDYKNSFIDYFFYKYNWFSEAEVKSLFTPDILNNNNLNDAKKPWVELLQKNSNLDFYDLSLIFFQKNHLKCLLNRLDTLTMANSLEARVPFLDLDLINAINSTPFHYKIRWKSKIKKFASIFSNNFDFSEKYDVNKFLLRKVSEKYLPKEICYRKKSGFPLPMNSWMKNERIKEILFDQRSKSRNIYNDEFIKRLYKKQNNKDVYDFNGKKIWMILNLELWLREFIDR